jgi:hypothetical protein
VQIRYRLQLHSKLTCFIHLGIIISISIIAALSLAVLENDQVKAWLEEQRQKIAELLRSIGEELDPQSRRQAEAFAFEGRTPATDEAVSRERDGSQEAAAIATGRSLSSASTVRRIPVQGRMDPDEAEERRRKGREYLAKRNQQMYELQQRRKESNEEGSKTPPTPTSFDAMVDEDGKLRLNGKAKELPSPPALELLPEAVKSEMREVERHLSQPLLVGDSSASASSSGWSFGSAFANPFSDEHALDRSETPKPPVPPKVALDVEEPLPMPGSFDPEPQSQQTEGEQEELSYEEQLAIALSLSEQEAQQSANAETSRRIAAEDEDDPDLQAAIAAAIEASLKEVQSAPVQSPPEQAPPAAAIFCPVPGPSRAREPEPLVDLSPPTPTLPAQQPRGHWETVFDQDYSPIREPLSLAHSDADSDELYRVTPDLPRARLVAAPAPALASPPPAHSMPYDPVREAAGQPQRQQGLMEASFYSAVSSAPSPTSSHTMSHEATPQIADHEATPQLIDVSEDVPFAETRTPMSPSSFGFETDESDSETFASMSAPRSHSHSPSRPRSEVSDVEVLDLVEDSDIDMLSNEGDGIVTPDSWTEVGSRDGDSEMEDEEPRRTNLI